jgi:hypothetical protein
VDGKNVEVRGPYAGIIYYWVIDGDAGNNLMKAIGAATIAVMGGELSGAEATGLAP